MVSEQREQAVGHDRFTRPLRPLLEVMHLLPRAARPGEVLDLSGVAPAEVEQLQASVQEVVRDGYQGLRAIGSLLFWASMQEEPTCDEYCHRVGLPLTVLADLLEGCREVEEACSDRLGEGGSPG